jgi:hypothetical protein
MQTKNQTTPGDPATADSGVVLVREAGAPFQPSLSGIDPLDEWMSLMEVVEMLCPDSPARFEPTVGTQWRL